MQPKQEQIDFFQTFGYLHFPALFLPDEVAWICEEFEYSINTLAAATSTTDLSHYVRRTH